MAGTPPLTLQVAPMRTPSGLQLTASASHVGLIVTLEPLFSAIVAYFLAGERLGSRGYIGAVLMMLSLVLMELDWSVIFRKKHTEEKTQ